MKQNKTKLYAKALAEVLSGKKVDEKKVTNNFVKVLVSAGLEKKAKEILDKAEKKQKQINDLLRQSFLKQQEEAKTKVLAEAGELIKKAIIKTVELKPDQIDDALIKKAVKEVGSAE